MPGLCRWLRWAKSPAFSGISCREGRSPRDIVMWWGSCEHSPTPDAIETPYECGFILKKENLPVCERWWSAHFSPDRPTLPLWSAESLGRPTEDLLHRSETKPGSACWPRSCASGGPSRTLALKVKLKTGNLSHCPLQSGCIQRKKKCFYFYNLLFTVDVQLSTTVSPLSTKPCWFNHHSVISLSLVMLPRGWTLSSSF